MNSFQLAMIAIAVMLALMAMRLPVGLAMLATGSAGFIMLAGWSPFFAYMKTSPYHLLANYTLSVIPLFVLMGALAERSGLSTKLFQAASAFVGHYRGGLTMAVIAACAGFGAICGSSVATTATFGRAALPELLKYKYNGGFATGTIAVGGTLGILIPPSVILIIYAISTEQNIAKLFAAALIPGLMAAIFYCISIFVMVRLRPGIGPATERVPFARRIRMLGGVWPVLLLAFVVVGGIYGQVFTPTEGAAVGAIAMLVIGLVQRSLGWEEIKAAVTQTAETSGMIYLILLGADLFNAFLARSRLPMEAADYVAGLGWPPYAVLGVLVMIYLVLGCLMDELAILLLTLPVFFPIFQALDFGMMPDEAAIWFGIIVLVTVGIGLTSPPIGLNVFVISSIAKTVPIMSTFRGVAPYIVVDVIRLLLIIAFPALSLWLVRLAG